MNKEILLVDDEQAVLSTLTKDLQGEGYSVDQALNGEEALKKFKVKGFYPIIILDLRMPVMSGNDFLIELRKNLSEETRVIILSGHGEMEDAIQCLNLHAFAYIKKEVISRDMNQLFQAVEEAFKDLTAPSIDEIREINKSITPEELEQYLKEAK